MKREIKRNREFVFILAITILFSVFFALNSPSLVQYYETANINSQVFEFSGVLFGLFLTAYAIFAGFIPALKKDILKTDAFSKVGLLFLIALISTLTTVALGLLIFFIGGIIKTLLICVQMTVFVFVILLGLIIILALHGLIRYMKHKSIQENS